MDTVVAFGELQLGPPALPICSKNALAYPVRRLSRLRLPQLASILREGRKSRRSTTRQPKSSRTKTLKKTETKIGNPSDVQNDVPSPQVPRPPNIASEISARHMDVNLAQDAKRVQERLADLGFYSGKKDGRWGPASRKALGEFKLSNGLVPDNRWDADTEQSLYAGQAHKWIERFFGGWATDVNDCQLAPITINPYEARSNSRVCEFKSVKAMWNSSCLAATAPPRPGTGTVSTSPGDPWSFRPALSQYRMSKC
jgi:hypothetical protein